MRRIRRFFVSAILLTLAAVVAIPSAALAATPPTILTAGFDVHDQLYATWSLAPGTRFRQVEFATLPFADPDLPDFFLEGQFAGYDSCRKASCGSRTSYTSSYPVTRDRRYFVKVSAIQGDEGVTSAVWVIDDAKPVIPGDADVGDGDSNAPVAGKPFDGASLIPPGLVPSASITFLKAPKTIRGLVRQGVPVRVKASVAASVATTIYDRSGAGEILGLRSVGSATGGTRTVAAKIDDFSRAPLLRRKRMRVKLDVVVTLADGTTKSASRFVTVRK